ncbi:HET-domain-containing protein [Cucurbitaria berberidis CBS 394.84]|uniref:HET-domain-containing protein n=1 Tax=Cucurbitaria berberidis CBS 394.84 TaxID=1168544 RepID=A0A9P4L3J0_9PLEO|nr:HET-domain-containing protein [Cucurbitaria berberidis CBS 394.84]KAF1840379.1 HET-domain-containing protein [Cucurbitaria berberidis CBS 394.84]
MPYQYQPLPVSDDPGDVYIRLLELHRGSQKTGPITGQLYSTLLSKAPAFHALSYCWGTSTRTGTIHITNSAPPRDLDNDNTLSIPTALIPFLYRTRARALLQPRTLWIDSICLNQKDTEEKNIHVPKMREIYMKATYTVSWLGPEADGSAQALEYADRLSKTYRLHMAEQKLITLTPEEEKEKDSIEKVQVKLGDPALDAMFKLLDRPYFERAWIVQEILVSRQVYFMCGNHYSVTSWEALLGAFLYLVQVHPWTLEFYSGHRIRQVVALRLSEMDWESSIDIEWFRTILRHRSCLSGDGRDKVFAFFGLRCKQALGDLGITPNYDMTTEVLYTQLAARALKKGQVVVLHVPRIVIGKEQEEDENFEKIWLPSWVPDWRYTEETPDSLVNAEGLAAMDPDYCATKDSKFCLSFDSPAWNVFDKGAAPTTLPKLIKLRGLTVARITHLTRRRWEIQKPTGRQTLVEQARVLQYNQLQIHEWEAVFRPSRPSQLYVATGESVNTAMYETFMAGSSQYTVEVKRAATAAFETRQRFLRVLYSFHLHGFLVCYIFVVLAERLFRRLGYANPEVQFRMMVMHMANRKGARMVSEGELGTDYLALVPSICKLGDAVVLVQGVKEPLILRPKGEGSVQVENGKDKTVRTWELIGDSYVHGVMKGEAWEMRKGECEDLWIA